MVFNKIINKTLCVIPARGGSKSIKRKNLIDLNGKPLIYYTLSVIKKFNKTMDIIVSTDDKEIKDYSESLGIRVPFIRPTKLSNDTALSIDVLKHSIKFMESIEAKKYDDILMLQPTSPLRNEKHIKECLKLFKKNKVNSLVSIVNVGAHHPLRMKIIRKNKVTNFIDQGFEDMRPRQHLPDVYIRNGAIYLSKRDLVINENKLIDKTCIPYEMDHDVSVNIDSESDLILAEYFLNKL